MEYTGNTRFPSASDYSYSQFVRGLKKSDTHQREDRASPTNRRLHPRHCLIDEMENKVQTRDKTALYYSEHTADDVTLFAESKRQFKLKTHMLNEICQNYNIKIPS